MTRATILSLLIVLAILGIADSVYLAESAMTDTALICDIGAGLDGCNTVAQSPYSKFLGIPLGVYGIGFYLLVLLVVLVAWAKPRRLFDKALIVVSLVGTVASLCFLAIQFFLIKATCIYCIGSAVITFLMLGLSVYLFKRFAPQLPAVIP